MSLLEIKKKIGSVKNTKKITKAMQLVAASKMQKFQKKALSSRGYVKELLGILSQNISSDTETIYTEERTEGPTLFVIYTSDKGLCGALNTKLLNTLFRSDKWNNTSDKLLITIGKKASEFAKNNKIDVAERFIGIPENINDLEALEVVDKILTYWRENKCSEIVFTAPHYKNSFTNYPVQKQFLPMNKEMLETHMGLDEEMPEDDEMINLNKADTFMLFNPSAEDVAERLHEQIVQGLFLQAFLELKAAEYSSRMLAMNNATEAADKMIDDLTLTFNKARQQAITQELAELIGASAAVENN
jgi:F-type H+-transporting ATPase subunit gamma